MYSPPIQKLIDVFSRFPTVGPRTAARFAFYLIGLSEEETNKITEAISNLRKNIQVCSLCFNPFEKENDEKLCPICRNKTRNKNLLCIVEKETDLNTLEKTKKYNGLYFILGQTNTEKLNQLTQRIKKNHLEEIIIALNPTTQGESEILRLERVLKPLNIKITRLGRGLPVGGELEYADEETLSSALERRK